MATILVTGADGFVGTTLCARLKAAGYSVRRAVRGVEGGNGVAVGDLATFAAWHTLVANVDAVLHLAARAHVVHETSADPLTEFRRVNVAPT
ncbi:MAG: NAD-dependent epimerase/dehydratase family protein, partial [Steroidobacteraceae bacterium]